MKKLLINILLILGIICLDSCKEEYLNPGAASEQQVINDANGLISLANGLQARFTVSRVSPVYNYITASGLSTFELAVLNDGNTDEANLRNGGLAVQGNNAVIRNLWEQCHLVKANADIVINNSQKITDAGTRSGLVAFASIFRALSLGTLAQFWEQAPIAVQTDAVFSSREDLLEEAIRTLETASTTLAATPPSATFTGRIVPAIDIPNTINALIARYSIMLGDNDKAIAASNLVNLTVKSAFAFDEASRNPMFETSFSNRNVAEPFNRSFGLPSSLAPDPNDKRTLFYFSQSGIAGDNIGKASFFTTNSSQIPVYLPGEMILIKAEAFARKSDLANAIIELNKVLTKTPSQDAWNVGASLPPYSGAITQEAVLQEIYRNRCIELFLSGMKLEDSRRFGRPGPGGVTAERNRTFYPYPQSEKDNNPQNTPPDPTE